MRAKYGLPALKHNPELDAVAITRANEIITKFDHVSASHAKTKYENAHAGKSRDSSNESLEKHIYDKEVSEESYAESTISDLMTDAHRKMILDPNDKYISVAVAVKNDYAYWSFISESHGDDNY